MQEVQKRITLRRYTDLPAAIYLLSTKRLTLLSPDAWDDRNDAYFMDTYRTRKGLASVLALCFTAARETYHHWRVFAPGASGVCIEFDKSELLKQLDASGIVARPVAYRKIVALGRSRPDCDELPFVKRLPYGDEQEFRLIWDDASHDHRSRDFPLDLRCISRVVLSPWMPKPLVSTTRELITSIEGCSKLKVTSTTLVDNDTWKGYAQACKPL